MYVKLHNGAVSQFPYNLGELKADNPNVSFPVDISNGTLADYEIYPVIETPPPSYDVNTTVPRQTVKEIDGEWTQTWVVERLPENQARENVRALRNQRLAASDWTQLTDAPVDHAEWAGYRQALRDITQQPDYPWTVQWPQQPS